VPFGFRLFRRRAVAGPVGGVQPGGEGIEPGPVGVARGGVESRARAGGRQPGAAGHQVQGPDLPSGHGEEGPQVVQAAAVPQPGPLRSRLQHPVPAVPGEPPLVGRRDQAPQQHGHAEALGDFPGPAAVLRRLPGIIPNGQGVREASEAMREVGQGADLPLEVNCLPEMPHRLTGLADPGRAPADGRSGPSRASVRRPGHVRLAGRRRL